MNRNKYRLHQGGFTIVELAIVIAIIAILTTITAVAYTGIKERSHDTGMRANAKQIVTALQGLYASGTKTDIGGHGSISFTNRGCVGGNGGWFSRSVSSYPCTVDRVLVDAGAIPSELTLSLPSSNKKYPTSSGYTNNMLYRCGSSGKWVFYYALHRADQAEITKIKTTCGGSPTASIGALDTYGMNGGIIFNPSGGQ